MEDLDMANKNRRRSSAWKDADKFSKIFNGADLKDLPLYSVNNGKSKLMDMLPDPPGFIPLRNAFNVPIYYRYVVTLYYFNVPIVLVIQYNL